MKTKKLSKKLALTKRTISDLNDNHLNQIKGGLPWTEVETCVEPTIQITMCISKKVCCLP